MKAEITASSHGNIHLILRAENAMERVFLTVFPQLGTLESTVDDPLHPTRCMVSISPLGDKEPSS